VLLIDERFLINRLSPGNIDETCRIFHQFKFPLSHHMIQGAGLDVFEKEPIAEDNPLLQLENVTLLPHIGSATE
jgi:hypothetical protein